MKKRICDVCGAELKVIVMEYGIRPVAKVILYYGGNKTKLDLCSKCTERLESMLYGEKSSNEREI